MSKKFEFNFTTRRTSVMVLLLLLLLSSSSSKEGKCQLTFCCKKLLVDTEAQKRCVIKRGGWVGAPREMTHKVKKVVCANELTLIYDNVEKFLN